MPQPDRYPIIVDELTTHARILNAAATLQDGRTNQARSQRKLADLLTRAAMHIMGTTVAQEISDVQE
jgi:hypothetical protein